VCVCLNSALEFKLLKMPKYLLRFVCVFFYLSFGCLCLDVVMMTSAITIWTVVILPMRWNVTREPVTTARLRATWSTCVSTSSRWTHRSDRVLMGCGRSNVALEVCFTTETVFAKQNVELTDLCRYMVAKLMSIWGCFSCALKQNFGIWNSSSESYQLLRL